MTSEISSSTRFLHALEMGLGAWEWGDRIMWQYGRTHTEEDIRAAFQVSVQEGIRFIDTAEVYGSGRSERLLGEFVRETQQTVLIATKFFPMPWRLSKDSVPRALRRSLERLGVESVDLYQIHWPTPLLSIETMMDGMTLGVEKGWTRTVGVSNFSSTQMINAYSALARNKIPLASNQVHFSLLNRDAEKSGLLARARELGVRVIAHSPLEMGILSGKYTPEHLPPGPRAAQSLHAPRPKRLTEPCERRLARSKLSLANVPDGRVVSRPTMSAIRSLSGAKRTCPVALHMSANDP